MEDDAFGQFSTDFCERIQQVIDEAKTNDNAKRIQAQESAVAEMNSRMNSFETRSHTSSDSLKLSVVNELKSINDRHSNVVIYNLPESAAVLSAG